MTKTVDVSEGCNINYQIINIEYKNDRCASRSDSGDASAYGLYSM